MNIFKKLAKVVVLCSLFVSCGKEPNQTQQTPIPQLKGTCTVNGFFCSEMFLEVKSATNSNNSYSSMLSQACTDSVKGSPNYTATFKLNDSCNVQNAAAFCKVPIIFSNNLGSFTLSWVVVNPAGTNLTSARNSCNSADKSVFSTTYPN